MLKKLVICLILGVSSVVSGGLRGDINKATCILEEQGIPQCVLDNACGIVIMSIVKGGFIFSGRVGKGIVLAKTGSGWSAPSGIGLGGAGWGLQAGAEITDFILILNTPAALDAFASGGSVTLGGNLSIAAGPVGGSAEGALALPPAAIFSYSRSKGLFAGASLEGTVLIARSGANHQFYRRSYSVCEILSGSVARPDCAQRLYQILGR